jgi:putative protease
VPEPARRLPLTEDLFLARIVKTGGTPYRCTDATVTIAENITMSAAAINGLRRDALDQLTALRARRDIPRVLRPRKTVHCTGFRGRPSLTVQVTNAGQLTEKLLRLEPAVLYVPLHILAADPRLCRDLTRRATVAAVLPRICHDSELDKLRFNLRCVRDQGVKAALVGNLGLLLPVRELGFRIHGDFGLNIYNSGSVEVAKDMELDSVMLSFEMTLPQIRDVSKPVPGEALAYGRLPLMVTENCLIRGRSGECTCHMGVTRLKDKTGADFPIIKDGDSCRSVLLNGKKLYWLDRQEDLRKLGLWATRLYFTTENPNEVDQVLSSYLTPAPFDPGACTRGLYLRGLD